MQPERTEVNPECLSLALYVLFPYSYLIFGRVSFTEREIHQLPGPIGQRAPGPSCLQLLSGGHKHTTPYITTVNSGI